MLPTQSFDAMLVAEELEERVEFAEWSASASGSASNEGWEVEGKIGVTF